jgi:kynureninase
MSQNFFEASERFAAKLDSEDTLAHFRERFHIPKQSLEVDSLYFTGNSLGLQPKTTREFINQELDDWAAFGVEGHFHAKNPWMPYHELLTEQMAEIVGGKAVEVVVMNSLTVNLHLLMVSFYRPEGKRNKIVIEKGAFPSDQYAVKSQIKFQENISTSVLSSTFRWQSLVEKPSEDGTQNKLIELTPREGETCLRTEDILQTIRENGDEIALILLGGVNYYTGQAFDFQAITRAGHDAGAIVGFDLAHAAGNILLHLHDWNVDFAAWCSYKYLNSGPGGIGGVFIHERHVSNIELPRFAGWWGHDKETRFLMGDEFSPIKSAEGWQLSNPPIFQLASLRASLEIFHEAGMKNLVAKSKKLTDYLEFLLGQIETDRIEVITPNDSNQRGCQLSIRVKNADKNLFNGISNRGVFADWREPDVIRVAPVPLYNSFTDCWRFVEILKDCLSK